MEPTASIRSGNPEDGDHETIMENKTLRTKQLNKLTVYASRYLALMDKKIVHKKLTKINDLPSRGTFLFSSYFLKRIR